MPYAPGVSDRSGEILAAGITNAAQIYADGQEKVRLTEKEVAHLAGTVNFAAEKGVVSPEDLAAFHNGNLAKKREIASKAGMAYGDYNTEQERAVLQLTPDEVARYEQAGLVPIRTSRNSFSPGQLPFQMSPEDMAAAGASGVTPVQTGRGHFTMVEKPPVNTGLQTMPVPGTNYVVPVYNGRPMGTLPTGAGAKAWQPTAEDVAAAHEGGFTYMNTADGPVLRSVRGSTAKPAPFRDAADAIYAVRGKPTADAIRKQQAYILESIKRPNSPEQWTSKNDLGETRAEEMARLAQELAAMTPRPGRLPAKAVQAPAQPTRRASAPVVASSGAGGKFAGPALPSNPDEALNTGDVLPPLPDAPQPPPQAPPPPPDTIPGTEDLPTVDAADVPSLAPGTLFRTTDGRVMKKR